MDTNASVNRNIKAVHLWNELFLLPIRCNKLSGSALYMYGLYLALFSCTMFRTCLLLFCKSGILIKTDNTVQGIFFFRKTNKNFASRNDVFFFYFSDFFQICITTVLVQNLFKMVKCLEFHVFEQPCIA